MPPNSGTTTEWIRVLRASCMIGLLGRLQAHLLAQSLDAEDVINQ